MAELIVGLDVGKMGLTFASLPPERTVIDSVCPGSWAAEAGLEPGDEISELNRNRAGAMSEGDFDRLAQERPLRLRVLKLSQQSTRSLSSRGSGSSSRGSLTTTSPSSSLLSTRSLRQSISRSHGDLREVAEEEGDKAGPALGGLAEEPSSDGSDKGKGSPVDDYDPERLWVVAPPRPSLQGEYVLVESEVANDSAVWRQVHGEGCLFSSAAGRWMLGDGSGLVRDRACIRSSDPHRGRRPHQVSKWATACGQGWRSLCREGLVRVTCDQEEAEWTLKKQAGLAARRAARAPPALWVVAPPRPALQGEYCIVEGCFQYNQPVWRQRRGRGLLVGSWEGSRWMICEEASKHEDGWGCGAEIVTSEPTEPGVWKYRDGNGGWIVDSIGWIRVSIDREAAESALENYGV